ncbi:hypothetical protein PVAP13_9KG431123 [Panicum virgatum]|uniref:Uncharacterized protein n=1 Tax=Panicum virgatum TaxID=38727 RepID=A0A8T0NSC8_PANVG|nr:hypothetical protein PVAP13_9KG431123 [Panicum virgatum]KAG2552193.1 hypothetical protein PVAP13_9KG431123 [Panicum virgatum]KAG2552194.1 hypothetical protein PVAP13_9KG431123 [Panicum virgatum]
MVEGATYWSHVSERQSTRLLVHSCPHSLSTVSLSSRIHRAISDFLDPRGYGEGGEGGTCGIEAGEGNRRTKPRSHLHALPESSDLIR